MFAALLLLVGVAAAALVGVDLGNEYTKIAYYGPKRTLEIVLNRESKRKTSSYISFGEIPRVIAADAEGHSLKKAHDVFRRLTDILNHSMQEEDAFSSDTWPIVSRFNSTSGVREFHLHKHTQWLRPEEVVGHYLQQVVQNVITPVLGGSQKIEAVFTVPVSATMRQRQALVAAASIAGIETLGLVRAPAAAALHGLRDYNSNFTGTKLFVDFGSGSLSSCLVDINVSGKRREATVNKCVESREVSGALLEDQLLALLIGEVENKLKVRREDLPTRALMRLLAEVRKTKLVLSTNKQASVYLDGLYQGKDFVTTVYREDFERRIAPILANVPAVISAALGGSPEGSPARINGTEVIGGAWRVPAATKALEEALKPEPLGQHLNGDEAAVMGAALMAANMSSSFRVKDVKLADRTDLSYKLRFRVNGQDADERVLIEPNSCFGGWKSLLFDVHNHCKKDLLFDLYEENPRQDSNSPTFLTRYVVENLACPTLEEGGATINATTVNVTFAAPFTGILSLESVELMWTSIAAAEEKKSSQDDDSNEGTSTEAPSKTPQKDDESPKVETFRKVLDVRVEEQLPLPLSEEELVAAKERLAAFVVVDDAIHKLATLQNELESFVYGSRDFLTTPKGMEVSNEEERIATRAALDAAEDWIYGDGAGAGIAEVEGKLAELRKLMEPMQFRMNEISARKRLAAEAAKLKDYFESRLSETSLERYDYSEDKVNKLRADEAEFQSNLTELFSLQAARPLNETPLFESSKINEQIAGLRRRLQIVYSGFKVKKPTTTEPPPIEEQPPAGKNDTNATTTASSAEEEAQEEKVSSDSESIEPSSTPAVTRKVSQNEEL